MVFTGLTHEAVEGGVNGMERLGRWARLVLMLGGVMSVVTACTPCYRLQIRGLKTAQTHGAWVYVHYAGIDFRRQSGSPDTFKVCKPIPDSVALQFTINNVTKDGVFIDAKPITNIRSRIPKGFYQNPARAVVFDVDDTGESKLSFRMKLSDITTKELDHPETPAEVQQRLKDERLWVAIQQNNARAAEQALEDGASLIQPWLGNFSVRPTGDDRYLSLIVMRDGGTELVDVMLSHGMTLRERPDYSSAFIQAQYGVMKRLEMIRIMLKHVANPNYGLAIPVPPGTVNQYLGGDGKKERLYDRLIYIAAVSNNIELVKLLLEYGAEVHYRLPKGRFPPDWYDEGEWFLDWAKREASPEVKAVLFAGGQEPRDIGSRPGGK